MCDGGGPFPFCPAKHPPALFFSHDLAPSLSAHL
jgi:hypothetical protein